MRQCIFGIFSLSLAFWAWGEQKAIVPKESISLMDDPTFAGFTHFLNPEKSLSDNREEIWSIKENGLLHVSGKGWGYLRTNATYRDYHLVLEYQWGEHTVGERADRARDSGLLLHASGPDGAHLDSWISSIEAQLIEGGSGDILVIAPVEDQGKRAPARATADVRFDRDGEPVWSPDGVAHAFPSGERHSARINWRDRDPDWKDVKGFRGQKDLENPVGEWNRMEVICRNDTIRILLNGELVNEARAVSPTEGYVCIQSEGAELWVRRFELWPLDRFGEAWERDVASTDTGMDADGKGPMPRRFPWSPEKSLAAWQIDGDYEMELVAAEPIVSDPVDVVWDEEGRMFVAEMGDYPLPPEYGPLLSRIRLLSDEDGDGRMDAATTWADNLDQVQGMLPMKGGLLVTTRNAVRFLKDTDKDGKADLDEPLFFANPPRHNQLQVSSPRWGLDNAVYLNNGLDTTEIHLAGNPDTAMPFRGWDLRYDPRSRSLVRTTGRGQYGAAFDNWGRRFFSSNRNPIMFAVMSASAMERNPYAAITKGHEDVQAPASPVWPLRISHTTASAHLGTHTAACGIAVYRGELMPELLGNLFVCEPTGQLITRNRLVPYGASFRAERIGDKRDFIASSDEWTRPVQIRNGPDGALYICDMYRRFIDHARFFPEAFAKTNYMRAGLDQGRIWRLKPKGASLEAVQPLPKSSSALVELLDSRNAWQRIHAQRLLVERQDSGVVPQIEELLRKSRSATTRVHALWTLHGLGALTDEMIEQALSDREAGVVENAIQLANPSTNAGTLAMLASSESGRVGFLATLALGSSSVNPQMLGEASQELLERGILFDPWFRKAVLSAENPPSAELVAAIIDQVGRNAFTSSERSADLIDMLREFTAQAAARGDLAGMRKIMAYVASDRARLTDASIVQGLSIGLKRGSRFGSSLADFLESPPLPIMPQELEGIRSTLGAARNLVLDRTRTVEERLAALPLVRERGETDIIAVAGQLIKLTEPPELQSAACELLSTLGREKVATFFFDQWESLGPIPQNKALELLATNERTAVQLMRRMSDGRISPGIMPAFQRWKLRRSDSEEVRELAVQLFGQIASKRASVISEYAEALKEHAGNPLRGREVFEESACSTCHRIGDTGVDVGPSLTDVRYKLPEALLSDILDPNRAVEERWAVYTIETEEGKTYSGLIASETSSAIEIRLPGGTSETIAREKIVNLETSGASLMPEGMEGVVSKAEMADLIAFLTAQ